jgi:putative ABC transport system permease protein
MGLFESIYQDVRYALRMMRNNVGFTTVAILTLGWGIGATTAIFCVLNALMLRPLPVQDPDQLVEVSRSDGSNRFTYVIWKQLQQRQDVLSHIFAYGEASFDLADGAETHPVPGVYVSGDYFNTLGVAPILGRILTNSDDRLGAEPVCMISYGLWQRRFGLSQSVISQSLLVNGRAVEIVGVTPRGFFGVAVGSTFEVALPIETERVVNSKRPALDDPNDWWLSVVGRLEPGIGKLRRHSGTESPIRVMYTAVPSR